MLRKEEQTIFEFFLKLLPNFAGRPVKWQPGNDPPDVLCTDNDGVRIGVELGEWLNQGQMQAEREAEVGEKSFRDALRSEEIPHPANFGYVWIGHKAYARIKPQDADAFRAEMYLLVEEINNGWGNQPRCKRFRAHAL